MGTDDKPKAAQSAANANEMIDRLYEVAVDPSRYEALLDHWEAMIGPERMATNQVKPSIIGLDQLAGHIERADQVLDRVLRDDVSNSPQTLIDQIDHSAACAVNRDFTVIAANAGAPNCCTSKTAVICATLSSGLVTRIS